MYDSDDAFETEMYYERDPAAAAVDRLNALGYGHDDISVMMEDKTREKAFSAMVNAKGSEGVAAGATIGGVLGAIVAGLTATGSVAAIAGTGGLATPLVVEPLPQRWQVWAPVPRAVESSAVSSASASARSAQKITKKVCARAASSSRCVRSRKNIAPTCARHSTRAVRRAAKLIRVSTMPARASAEPGFDSRG